MAKDKFEVKTKGWTQAQLELEKFPKEIEEKYAIKATRELAAYQRKVMVNKVKNLRSANVSLGSAGGLLTKREANASRKMGASAARGRGIFKTPFWKSIKVLKLSRKARGKHGDVGYRVTFKGQGMQGRASMLEYGHRTRNGGMTRAQPFVEPARALAASKREALINRAIIKGLNSEAKKAANKIQASRKP